MAESLILLGVLGAGYFMNQKNNSDKDIINDEIKPIEFINSGNSVYDQTNYVDSRKYEIEKANEYHKLAMKDNTKIIDSLNMDGRNPVKMDDNNNLFSDNVQLLSGETITNDNFLKNDQDIKVEPFFSGSGGANINYDDNTQLTRHQGGNHAFRPRRTELGQFFEPQREYGLVHGNTFNGPSSDQSRYIGGMMRNNELPFEQERIIPIDDKNNINREVGMAFANLNSTENRRTLNDQKESYAGKVVSGKNITQNRGTVGEVFQHRPDGDYEQKADQWLVTTGAITSNSIRPEQVLKDTNRSHFNEGKLGPATSTTANFHEERPLFKKSTNQQLNVETNRNMTLEDKASTDDYNKNSFFAYPNERDITSERTYEGNIKSIFDGNTERLYDELKPTIKQTTLDDSRNGFVGSGITSLPEERLYDEMRPTKKQTTLDDSRHGFAGSYLPGSTAQDQFYRADQNINKEIISQGRYPVPEKSKIANGTDKINMDIKKIESDYFMPTIRNMDKLYTEIPSDISQDIREYTQDKDTLDNVKLADRLDPNMLDPFRENPYTQSLSSFVY